MDEKCISSVLQRNASPRTTSEAMPFNVVLHCTKTDQTEEGKLQFKSNPLVILDVKRQIEKQFNVPVCIQVLSYDGQTLKNDVRLLALRVRDGDTFHVEYLEKGHCAEIVEIITSLSLLLATLRHEKPSIYLVMSAHLDSILTRAIQEEVIEDLAFKYFYPWLDTVKYVNKLHFVYNGGIEILMQIFAAAQHTPWDQCVLKMKYMEYGILRVIWNFSETFPLRRAVTRNNGIEMCVKSMLRVRLKDGYQFDADDQDIERALLRETIVGGLGTLCNLSELPEYHMQIASNAEALEQMSLISNIRSFPIQCSHYVAAIFLCIAYTTETHKLISHPVYMRKLLDAFKVVRVIDESDDEGIRESAQPLLRYFTLVYIAQVTLVSLECIPATLIDIITEEMESFLKSTSYTLIMHGEMKQKYVWCTFLPYVKLAYIPNTPYGESPVGRLQHLSLQLILFALQNMLGRDNHRAAVLKEELLDYVTCMPQYVPASLRPQAEELVRMVASSPDIPEGPPKLLNLVKARLAKIHFGLEQVLSLSVSEIVSKVLPT